VLASASSANIPLRAADEEKAGNSREKEPIAMNKTDSPETRSKVFYKALDGLLHLVAINEESAKELAAHYVSAGTVQFDCDSTTDDGRRVPVSIQIGTPTSEPESDAIYINDLPQWRVKVEVRCDGGNEYKHIYIVPAPTEEIAAAIAQARMVADLEIGTEYMLHSGGFCYEASRLA
jgi:hypothetical protein